VVNPHARANMSDDDENIPVVDYELKSHDEIELFNGDPPETTVLELEPADQPPSVRLCVGFPHSTRPVSYVDWTPGPLSDESGYYVVKKEAVDNGSMISFRKIVRIRRERPLFDQVQYRGSHAVLYRFETDSLEVVHCPCCSLRQNAEEKEK